MIKLEDSEVAEDDRPEDPHKILKTKVYCLNTVPLSTIFAEKTFPRIIVAGSIQYFILPSSNQRSCYRVCRPSTRRNRSTRT